ncbi:peptide methionine sulfoxide reductase A2-1-like [Miscanthus floridulus]|uniref:peptide methionine sulfoxide reductase A2-1-like n=1 Tax=Miscanthus floridulus TaxID=154761 RepID=UPI0034599B70
MSAADAASPALAPDGDAPAGEGLALAQFAAGCFWSVELVYQRLPGVARTEVGYSQVHRHAPTYRDVCGGGTGHAEVVRVHYDPNACPYDVLLDVFWAKHNPTTLNRQVRARFLKTHTLDLWRRRAGAGLGAGTADRSCRRRGRAGWQGIVALNRNQVP